MEAPIVPSGLQQQQMATVDKSGDTDPMRIPFVTSEASNLRTGYQPVRNSEIPMFIIIVSIVISSKTLDQKGPMFA